MVWNTRLSWRFLEAERGQGGGALQNCLPQLTLLPEPRVCLVLEGFLVSGRLLPGQLGTSPGGWQHLKKEADNPTAMVTRRQMLYDPSLQKPGCDLQGGVCTEPHSILFYNLP